MTERPLRKLEGMDLHQGHNADLLDPTSTSKGPETGTGTGTGTISDVSPTSTTPTSHSSRLPVRTYHCRFCSHLLVATTRDLSRLPRRRRPPALDGAVILPLSVKKKDGDAEGDEDQHELDTERDGMQKGDIESQEGEGEQGHIGSSTASNTDTAASVAPATPSSKPEPPERGSQAQRNRGMAIAHLTLLLSTTYSDRKHTVVRREDGFEKRLLLRCGRCRLVVGYFLDDGGRRVNPSTRAGVGSSTASSTRGEDAGQDADDRPQVVYILPGALVETSSLQDEGMMKAGDREWVSWVRD